MKAWLSFAMVSCVAITAHAGMEEGVENRPCLDYWAVGTSKGCAPPEKKKKPEVAQPPSPTVPPPAVAANTPPSDTLDNKVDEFLKNHGKPPREFVAFYLDPTPEHAVQWVAKYNELLQRGQDIALAWTQAETLYNNAIQAGTPAKALNPSPFPVVPDFGIPVPGFNTPAFPQLMGNGKGAPVVKADLTANLTPDMANPYAEFLQPPDKEGLVKPVTQDVPALSKPLEVSYYFSAVCPYCKKFEPGFSEVVRELGSNIRLTCVDVTPAMGESKPSPENVHDLPCVWREAKDGELAQVGVKQTPSLVVDKGVNQPLELIAGYVDPAQVEAYLVNVMKSLKQDK